MFSLCSIRNPSDLSDAQEYVLFDETRAADMENDARGQRKGGGRMQESLTLGLNDGEVSKEAFLERSKTGITLVDHNEDSALTAACFDRRTD
ncbi:MAG: hypothetical protein R8G34_13190 [Paracoccaceae bacterium]|nr:hypothetical protein [Paracoccaceae bacterium]